MGLKQIYSSSLQNLQALQWRNEGVFEQHSRLQRLMKTQLGEECEALFSVPVVKDGNAEWYSDSVSNPIPFSQLTVEQRDKALRKLQFLHSKINFFLENYKNSKKEEERDFALLVEKALVVPNENSIFVEDEKIVLVLWGFQLINEQQKQFKIFHLLNLEKEKVSEKKNIPSQDSTIENVTVQEKNENSELKTEQISKKTSSWLWLAIGAVAMLLIFILLYFFVLKNDTSYSPYLPDKAGVIVPIDTSKITVDNNDPLKRKIVGNRLNIVVKQDVEINIFLENLYNEFSETDLKVIYWNPRAQLLQFEFTDGNLAKWQDYFRKHADVQEVSYESIIESHNTIPADPGFQNPEQSWLFNAINAYLAFDITMGEPTVVVAIIDNCFDLSHPEFAGKIMKPFNANDGNSNVYVTQGEGNYHGTHVAGTSIALSNNAMGVSGIAPNCKFMPVQTADRDGMMSTVAILEAIYYAVDQGADVINMSLGSVFEDYLLQSSEAELEEYVRNDMDNEEQSIFNVAYQYAADNNVIIVKAAGNEDVIAHLDPMNRSENIIVVTAVSPNKDKADFSNYGNYSTVSAPGVDIYSTMPNGEYDYLQGTSMAAPVVAGAVALLKSVNRQLSVLQAKEILRTTGIDLGTSKYIGPFIQIDKALAMAQTYQGLPCGMEADSLRRLIRETRDLLSNSY